jgi:DNA-binding beta-propeller fold protein YncE
MKRRWTISVLSIVSVVAAMTAMSCGGSGSSASDRSYEVWLLDQSDTRADGGGRLLIYPGSAVDGGSAATALPEVHDFGGAVRVLALSKPGSPSVQAPRRPHMVLFNSAGTHAVIAFVVTGHVLFLDTATRTPLDIIDVGLQVHVAVPSPNDRFVLVAGQNGKILQRINTDYASNTFTLDYAATLNLAAGTTPGGALREDPVLRPDNAPIYVAVTSDSRYGFVTLRGGGLFVVDIAATPMRIVAEYDNTAIKPAGFAGAQSGTTMYINSGTSGTADPFGHDLYAIDIDAIAPSGSPPNLPAPRLIYRRTRKQARHEGEPGGGAHTDATGIVDAHGILFTGQGRYLWVADRIQNDITVVDTATDAVVNMFSLAGAVSLDPAPDLLALSPRGNYAFATLRGPFPGSGGHAAFGASPGLGVIRVEQGGRAGTLQTIAPLNNGFGSVGGENRADPHGIAVLAR